MLFSAFLIFAHAQNLLVNPSFETWTNGTPDGWAVPAIASQAGTLTISQETTIVSNGLSALRIRDSTINNPGFQQILPITAGKTYTVSASYYVVSGDGTDARIWSTFKNGATVFATADWTTAATTDATIQTKLQGSGSSTSAYFSIANDVWGTYSVDFIAPANATEFILEFRTYKTATVIWDNMFFGEKISGLNSISVEKLKLSIVRNKLIISNVADGTVVNIFSMVGSKVQTAKLKNSAIILNNLSNGLYIVRIGNQTAKFKI